MSTMMLKTRSVKINPEMSQFLRLHAREDDFATTVLKARQFVDASELIKPKKSVKIISPSPSHDAQVHCTQDQGTDQNLVISLFPFARCQHDHAGTP